MDSGRVGTHDDGRQVGNWESPVIERLVQLMWRRDVALAQHALRVAELAVGLGSHLGLGRDQLQRLRIAAMLHDLGKVHIAPAILGKPAPLTDREWTRMRLHPRLGYYMVTDLVHPEVTESVLAHHERYDGRGYPLGRGAAEIPLLARALFVADAFDAMTSDRPYQPALPVSRALHELRSNAGSQFDPGMVTAMEHLVAAGAATRWQQPAAFASTA